MLDLVESFLWLSSWKTCYLIGHIGEAFVVPCSLSLSMHGLNSVTLVCLVGWL